MLEKGVLLALRERVKKWWAPFFLVTGVAAGCIWYLWDGRRVKQDVPAVKADTRILAEGIVYPVQYAEMAMPVNGMVGEVLVQEGDRVYAGQPIIRLVREEYQARVGSAWSDAARASAMVEQSRVNLADAEREYRRQKSMEAAGATPRQLIEQARTAVERNQAALAQAQADFAAIRGKALEAERLLEKTELRASIDGSVVFIDVKVGEHSSAGTVLVRIANLSAWEVRSDDLTELMVAKVHVGDQATLTFDGIPGLEIPGKVKSMRNYGEKKRGDITYTVSITPDYWDNRLRWMMTGQIAILPRE